MDEAAEGAIGVDCTGRAIRDVGDRRVRSALFAIKH